MNGTLPGICPEIARQMRRIIRRIDFGNADGDPADIRADGGRYCGVIAAGNPPENRRTQNPSVTKGFGFASVAFAVTRPPVCWQFRSEQWTNLPRPGF
jgi:hypothetical protein